jgi:hypothetical protein
MANKISRYNICDEFFNSKRELKDHKDKNHRIAGSEMEHIRIRNNSQA